MNELAFLIFAGAFFCAGRFLFRKKVIPSGWRGIGFVRGNGVAWFVGMDGQGNRVGVSCRTYSADGTLAEIIPALERALEQARFDAGVLPDDANVVPAEGRPFSFTEPDHDIPGPAVSRSNYSRESRIESPVTGVLFASQIAPIVRVSHQHHVALNVAIDLCGFVGSKFNSLVEMVSHPASKEHFCGKVRSNICAFRAAGNAHVPASSRVFHNTAARFILSLVVAAAASRLRTLRAGLAARLSRSLPAISAHNAAARKSFWFGGTEESGRCRWTLAASALFLHIFRAQEGAERARRGGSFWASFTSSPGAKPGSCHGFAGRDETAGKSSCVLGLPKLNTVRLAALAFMSVSAALLLSGCEPARSAWQSYDRSVSRDIAIGASQDRGGYASYTVHLGPQSARRAPDFKQPVEAMKGVTW